MVAITQFDTSVAITVLVEIPRDRNIHQQLLQLKSVTSFHPCRELAIFRKHVASHDVELVSNAATLAVAKVKRV